MASHIKIELEEVVSEAQTESPPSEEELRKELRKAIREEDEDSFHRHLSGLDQLLQDDNRRKELLDDSLAYASYTGFQPAVETLVQKGGDVNAMSALPEDSKSPYRKETPLHIAVHGVRVDNPVMYLDYTDAHPDEDGGTPLHWAAWGGHVYIVRYLVEQGADINIEDEDEYTPLHAAVLEGHVDIVRYLVDKDADPNIKDKNGYTPLHTAAREGHVDMVRYLVDKGADPNISRIFSGTPLHLAAEAGHMDIVRHLVEKGADINIKDDTFEATPLYNACGGGDVETVEYLLDIGADPTAKDRDGQTPLSWAIRSRHKDVAASLLEQKKWEEMLRSSDRESITPVRGLIAFMPDVAERAFSRCVTTNKGKESWQEEVHADSRKLEVKFNYEFLEDFQDGEEGETNIDSSTKSWQPKKFTKHSHPLFLIKKHGCSKLMKHPLVISLLDYKWKKFGRYIFFGNLLIYLIFLVFLTAFALVILSPVERPCTEVLNGSFNGTTPEDCGDLTIDDYQFLFIGAVFTIATALLRLAIELTQLCRHPLEYLQDWANWLEIPLYFCSMIFTFVFATPCFCVYNWQWQFGTVTVFLGWIGLVSFLQKWPVTGVYILMFINIIQSFLKIAFLALLLVIAFALAFYMLFFEPDEMRNAFSHPGRAIVKVMTMTTGELDYDEIFHQQEGEKEIAFLPVAFIVWVIFLVLIPVLLNNLLVGLAVGDVDSRLKTAFQNRIELQIDLVLTCEELLESWPIMKLFGCLHIHRWYAIQKSRKIYPNTPETLLPLWCKGGGDDFERNMFCGGDVDQYLANYPKSGKSDRARRWVAKRYAKWWITDDYSTSGVNLYNKINPAQKSDEQAARMKEQTGQLSSEMATLREELEAKLQQEFQEAIKQLSEEQTKKSEEQVKEMSWQLAGEVVTSREQLQQQLQEAIKLSEKQAQKLEEQAKEMNKQMGQLAAIKQLAEEQTQKSEEQTKEMKEQTAQLAAEVATLREALQKLITKMDV